jgi:hypothetical protein
MARSHALLLLIALLGLATPSRAAPLVSAELNLDLPAPFQAQVAMDPAVAFGASSYLVAWDDDRYLFTGQDVFAARVGTDGKVIDAEALPITMAGGDQAQPHLAFDGSNWFVTWNDGSSRELRVARVAQDGTLLDPGGISMTSYQGSTMGIAAGGGAMLAVVALNDNAGLNDGVYGILLRANGTPAGAPFLIGLLGDNVGSAVAFDGTNFLVTYVVGLGTGGAITLFGQRVSPAGTLVGSPIMIDGSSGISAVRSVVVSDRATGWLVPYSFVHNLRWVTISDAGSVSAIQTLTGSGDWFDASYAAGAYTVALTVPGSGNGEVLEAARISRAGALLGTVTTLEDGMTDKFPQLALAFDGTNQLATYARLDPVIFERIEATRLSPASPQRLDVPPPVVSLAASEQRLPAVAWNGSEYLVVWSEQRQPNQLNQTNNEDIYATRVTAAGVVLDPDGLPVSTDAGLQASPSVASNGADFLVTWESQVHPSDKVEVHAARVSAAGVVRDQPGLTVAASSTTDALAPRVASDGSDYLVVWLSSSNGATVGAVQGVAVTAGGVVSGAPAPIASAVATASPPALAYNGARYLVAWSTSGGDIRAARVDGGAHLVDATSTLVSGLPTTEAHPALASNGTDWLVVWDDASDVRGARVAADGTLRDAGGLGVSRASGTSEVTPAVAWDGQTYLVSWADYRNPPPFPGGSNADIYGARIAADGTAIDAADIQLTDGTLDEIAPASAAAATGQSLVVYQRSDPAAPFENMRARGRLVSEGGGGGGADAGSDADNGDAGAATDAGRDAGAAVDAGHDSGTDGGTPPMDAGADGHADAPAVTKSGGGGGCGCDLSGSGPRGTSTFIVLLLAAAGWLLYRRRDEARHR